MILPGDNSFLYLPGGQVRQRELLSFLAHEMARIWTLLSFILKLVRLTCAMLFFQCSSSCFPFLILNSLSYLALLNTENNTETGSFPPWALSPQVYLYHIPGVLSTSGLTDMLAINCSGLQRDLSLRTGSERAAHLPPWLCLHILHPGLITVLFSVRRYELNEWNTFLWRLNKRILSYFKSKKILAKAWGTKQHFSRRSRAPCSRNDFSRGDTYSASVSREGLPPSPFPTLHVGFCVNHLFLSHRTRKVSSWLDCEISGVSTSEPLFPSDEL